MLAKEKLAANPARQTTFALLVVKKNWLISAFDRKFSLALEQFHFETLLPDWL